MTDDIVFNPTIDQQNPGRTFAIIYYSVSAYICYQVIRIGIVKAGIVVAKYNLPHHSPLFTDNFGQLPGINAE